MERLNRYYKFKVSIPATVMASPAVYFKLSLMNINSLKPHFKCLAVDEMVTCSDVISLTETWLRPTDNSSQFDLPQKPIVRQDSLETRHGPSGGVAVYLSTEFHLVRRCINGHFYKNYCLAIEILFLFCNRKTGLQNHAGHLYVYFIQVSRNPANGIKHFIVLIKVISFFCTKVGRHKNITRLYFAFKMSRSSQDTQT